MIGGLRSCRSVWAPGAGRRSPAPSRAGRRPRRRSPGGRGRLLAVAVVLGVLVSVLGILLQGASAAGVSLWSSLKGDDHRRHARKPLRLGVGPARARLAAARRAAARRPAAGRDPVPARSPPGAGGEGARAARRQPPARLAAGGARRSAAPTWRSRPRSPATRASRARRGVFFPVRRAPRAGRERVGRRDRLPAARAARRDPAARGPRAHAAAARHAARASRRWRSQP